MNVPATCGAVLVFQVAHYGLEFYHLQPAARRSRLWTLIGLNFSVWLIGLLLLLSFRLLRMNDDVQTVAMIMMVMEGGTVLSIWCTQMLTTSDTWMFYHDHKKPFTFWVVFISLGMWLLAKHRIEVAVSIISHVHFSAMAIDALASQSLAIPNLRLLWLDAVTGVCATIMAVVLLIWVPDATAWPCLPCMVIISGRAIGDWCKADDVDLRWWKWSKNPECQDVEGQPDSPGPSPHSGILCVREVQEEISEIPEMLFGKPAETEQWVRCFVLVPCLDSILPIIERLNHLHIVGKTSDWRYYEVAMCDHCVQYFSDIRFPFLLASESCLCYNILEPSKQEIYLHGFEKATENARRRSIRNGVEAAMSRRHGKGLAQYYLDYTSDPGVSAAIRWGFVICNILDSEPEVFRQFLRLCVYIALHSLQDLDNYQNLGILERDEKTWRTFFRDLCVERTAGSAFDPKAEMQVQSLLQGALESAHPTSARQYLVFDGSFPATENIDMWRSLFDCTAELKSVPLGSFTEEKMQQILPHFKIFGGVMPNVLEWNKRICCSMPVGHSEIYLSAILERTEQQTGFRLYKITEEQRSFIEQCGRYLTVEISTAKQRKVQKALNLYNLQVTKEELEMWKKLNLENGYPREIMDLFALSPESCWKVVEEHLADVVETLKAADEELKLKGFSGMFGRWCTRHTMSEPRGEMVDKWY